MTYVRGARQAQLEATRQRQAAATAEAIQAEAELAALTKAQQDLARVQRRRDKALAELLKIRDTFNAETAAAETDLQMMRDVRQEIAAAARKAAALTGKAERELSRTAELESDLRRLSRERHRMINRTRDAQQNSTATIHQMTRRTELPPPIHGGREGLEAAAREAHEHEQRRVGDGLPKRRKVA